jgi:hypothetical protein
MSNTMAKGGSYVVKAKNFFAKEIRDARGVSRPCHRGKVRCAVLLPLPPPCPRWQLLLFTICFFFAVLFTPCDGALYLENMRRVEG